MTSYYDVIIIGAGSAGCVLANRLSRNPDRRVLLLEAGGSDRHPLVAIPAGSRKVFEKGWYNWHDLSDPEPELGGRQQIIPHGRILGGSSSLNYMALVRGDKAAFDHWESLGATGWGSADVLPHFRSIERWAKGADEWRGGHGEVHTMEPPLTDPIHQAFAKAVQAQGHALTPDYNGQQAEGFGPIQYTSHRGRRSSSSRAFLRPALKRQNLTLRTHSQATRILFQGSRAVGVEYRRNGQVETAYASDRILLSGGGVNSPHLLLLSGVGPADHLRAAGIKPLVDLPVGQNLEDHFGFGLSWTRPEPGEFHQSLRLDRIGRAMVQAWFLRSGPASSFPGCYIGFMKSRPEEKLLDLELILSTAPATADVWFPGIRKPYEDGYSVRVWNLGQESRGDITLRSTDPLQRPAVRYNALSHPNDIVRLREGYRRAWDIGASDALAPFRKSLVEPTHELRTDAEIDTFVRANSIALFHPACACRMGRDGEAVTNPDMSVKGLENLYVVDASAMPHLPSGGPNIVAMMMAEKAVADWKMD